MRCIVILFGFFFLLSCKSISEREEEVFHSYINDYELKVGDLLFQDLDCGPFCDAIEKVTYGINGADFSHNGLISRVDGQSVYVIEANSQGVIETHLDTFLNRSFDDHGRPKTIVGRLKPELDSLALKAVIHAQKRLGADYDYHFDIVNDRYYCSELLYYAFKEANEGQPVFQLRSMTYIDPDTKLPFPQWVEYFEDLNAIIPEGRPGLNPGSMSRSIYIDVVHQYGKPEGWRGKLSDSR